MHTCQHWIVVRPVDKTPITELTHRTRREAIEEFITPTNDTWKNFRKRGWRCVKCTVTWEQPKK